MERKYQVMVDEEAHRRLKTICASSGLTMSAGLKKVLDITEQLADLETPGAADYSKGGIITKASQYISKVKNDNKKKRKV